MEYTHIEQNAYAINIDAETVEYRLETEVMEAGELPSTAIFVYGIEQNDPSADAFLRVANVNDLTELKIDRTEAEDAGDTEYRRSANQIQYQSLDVAKQAKEMIRSRINDLINTWVTFRDDFQEDNDTIQYFPTVDPDYETKLKEDYAAARATRVSLESQVATQEVTVATAQTSAEQAQLMVDTFTEAYDFCVKTLVTNFPYYVSLVFEDTAATTYRTNTLEPEMNTYTVAVQADLTQWKNTKTSRDQVISAESAELVSLQAQVVAAKEAEEAALAAVRAVCPDFDPASV